MRYSILIFLLSIPFFNSFAQICSTDQNTLIVEINTDRFGQETSWVLSNGDAILGGVGTNVYVGAVTDRDTFCIATTECLTFTIFDRFGDGIPDGGYELFLNGTSIAANGTFVKSESVEINCTEGTSCSKAIPVVEGDYIAPAANSWYVFTPDSIGTYEISTCNNTCDTKIWVYDRCESFQPGDSEGFLFFNQDACGIQAKVNALLDVGTSYLIRISDSNDNCGKEPIQWELTYNGPIKGCMDPFSCNYNPLATIEDGNCIPQGNPACPSGPDLSIRQDVLLSSIIVDTINNEDDCLINEGCLKGFGRREVIRFTTRFENIGQQDYYIGKPTLESNQFTFDNCHDHFHYDNYAEYLLFDAAGNRLPAGFKSGFCVVDLNCSTGTSKYGCSNMGLTVGCYDEYLHSLDCQWIDVTDYPDGNYTFVARVNWGNQPDLVGRVETNLENNWSQVCLSIDRSSGQLLVAVQADCPVFVDCEGTVYGSVEKDCNGLCGGSTLTGDVDGNSQQDMLDVQEYFSMIMEEEIQATPCTDLNGDDLLSVYDVALLSDCLNFGQVHQHVEQGLHNHCDFPAGIKNILDTASLQLISHNTVDKTIEVAIKNNSPIVGYQFQLQGISIQSVENLIPDFSIQLQASINKGEILGLSLEGAAIEKSRSYQPFLRIHYLSITEPIICIDNIADIVNGNYQQTINTIEGTCLDAMLTSIPLVDLTPFVKVQPNPLSSTTTLSFPNQNQEVFTLKIYDAAGRLQSSHTNITSNQYEWSRAGVADGLYFFQLQSEHSWMRGKLVVN